MERLIINIIYFFILLINLYSCSGNIEEESIQQCFYVEEEDKERCFGDFFDTLFSEGEKKKIPKYLILDNDKDILYICNELSKEYKNDAIKRNLFQVASRNRAYCACKYARNKIKKGDDKYLDIYIKYYNYNCKK